jgi:hypothetical protein
VHKRECDRQGEVLQAVSSGRVGDELQSHIAGCAGCSDLLEVAAAIVDDRSALMREAHLPSSGLVWWRANMRARQQAARTAVRTASFVQVVLLVGAIVIALAVVGVNLASVDYRSLLASGLPTIPLFAFAAWLILAPVAVYFAVTEE